MSIKLFENLVTISVVFNVVPEFVGSESDRLVGHCQSVWSGSKSRGGLGDESYSHSALKSSQTLINSHISSHNRSNRHSNSARK
jgi:hypothetical protein